MSSEHFPMAQLETTQWVFCEPFLRGFEAAWQAGRSPRIRDFLPAEEKFRLPVLFELVLTDMEFCSKVGESPRVEKYLAEFPELSASDSLLTELVVAEWELRCRNEGTIETQKFTERFPRIANSILARIETWASQSLAESRQTVSMGPNGADSPSHIPMSDLPGFKILSMLGSGSMGIVYEARVTDLDRRVALKFLRTNVIAKEQLKRFLSEAEASASLHHPNIVRLFSMGEHDQRPFLVLEFVDGNTLEDVWNRLPPTNRVVAETIETLARAVHYAHEKGIVHRDLKPSNVLVDTSGRPRITDFGLAKGLDGQDSMTMTGEVLGTPAYMSPEQARGESKAVGRTSDVYSLGAMLYRGLTGRAPFIGSSLVDTMALVRWSEPKRPCKLVPRLPIDLETICLKCLAKEPINRYQSAEALAEDLRHFLNSEPIQARRTPWHIHVRQRCRRYPMVTALLVSILVIGMLGSAIVYRQWQDAKASLAVAMQRDKDRLNGLIDSLVTAAPESASAILENLRRAPIASQAVIRERIDKLPKDENDAASKKNSGINRLRLISLDNSPQAVDQLIMDMVKAEPAEFAFYHRELSLQKTNAPSKISNRLLPFLISAAENDQLDSRMRFQSALAASLSDPTQWSRWTSKIVDYLLEANPFHLRVYHQLMQPLPPDVIHALNAIAIDRQRSDENRQLALRLLAEAHAKQLSELLELVKVASDDQLILLLDKIEFFHDEALPKLRQEATEPVDYSQTHEMRDRQTIRVSNAILSLFYLRDFDHVWPHLRSTPRPDLRTFLIHRIPKIAINFDAVVHRMTVEPDPSIRQALLLMIGSERGLAAERKNDRVFIESILTLYQNDPDAGVHSAARWLLMQLDQANQLERIDHELSQVGIREDRNWYVTPHGHSMMIVRGPVTFMMGDDPEKLQQGDRSSGDRQGQIRINRSWAIGMYEVTATQYKAFLPTKQVHPVINQDSNGPQTSVHWFEAAKYCRWLSEQEKLSDEEMCFPDVDAIKGGCKLPKNYLSRTGYRFPSEAEWEYACRAGSDSRFHFGDSKMYADRYAWTMLSSNNRVYPPGILRPNDFGLFDCHGNCVEWCMESFSHHEVNPPRSEDVEDAEQPISVNLHRSSRGGAQHFRVESSRSTLRRRELPVLQGYSGGFRLARTLP